MPVDIAIHILIQRDGLFAVRRVRRLDGSGKGRVPALVLPPTVSDAAICFLQTLQMPVCSSTVWVWVLHSHIVKF